MSKFKSGDRVAIYTSPQASARPRQTGTVITSSNHTVIVMQDVTQTAYTFHAKQLRRLKPKAKPRRVWITTMDIPKDTGIKYHCMVSTWPERHGPGAEWVEFVEVKKGGTS